VRSVTEDTGVTQAAEALYSLDVKQLPVLRHGEVVGVISRSDVIRALGRLGTELETEAASDESIADAIGSRISRAGWVSPQQVRYTVREGCVEYAGTVTSEDQRRALHALAHGVPGVREVMDRIYVTGRLAARPA
jgi:osmotically-inducible protein OsmY